MKKTNKAACERCSLRDADYCYPPIIQSKLLLLGEAPGEDEISQGSFFVGRAGRHLMDIIKELGLTRNDIALDNACLCRPVVGINKNRAPTYYEVLACSNRLISDIVELKPSVIVTLGRTAYTALAGETDKMMREIVGRDFSWHGIFVIPTYHPSFSMRDAKNEKGYRDTIKRHISLAVDLVNKGRQLKLF